MILSNVSTAATITINNLDGAGEGFNDATAATPVGGNPGTTVGSQRVNLFQKAADILGAQIQSTISIVVDAKFDPLFCDASSAVLGSAGPNTVFRDFTNAPIASTWYAAALADSIENTNINSSNDITATFNSNLNGAGGCLGGTTWYYGYDTNPGGTQDLLTVVLHEILHGIGFLSFLVNFAAQIFARIIDSSMTSFANR